MKPYWVSADDASVRVMDPVWYWADLTKYQNYLQHRHVRVAVELHSPQDGPRIATLLQAQAATAKDPIKVAPLYLDLLIGGQIRFFTARVPPLLLKSLAAHVKRIKLGLIGRAEDEEAESDARANEVLNIGELDSPSMRARLVHGLGLGQRHRDASGSVAGLEFFRGAKAPPASRGAPVRKRVVPTVAVIDYGCAFAQPAFRASGERLGTRVRYFWDQGLNPGNGRLPELTALWPWQQPSDLAYGREACSVELDGLMQGVAQAALRATGVALPADRFEEACYVAAGLPELLQPWSHGTAVLGLAAGWPHAFTQRGSATPDAAAGADIIFVQLPKSAVDDLSGGWVTAYVLDALAYVLARAGGGPLVINLCIGSHAGPHDGGALLEAALDECAAMPGVTVVLAAGNAAGKKGHAMARIPAKAKATFEWTLPAGDPTQSFLELWYDRRPDEDAPQFTVHHDQVQCVSSGGARTHRIVRTQQPGVAVGAFIHLPQTQAGRESGMALLALAPTKSSGGAGAMQAVAPSGAWTVQVFNPSDAELNVHAWIERDEPGADTLPGRANSILSVSPAAPADDDRCTLTAQATGAGTLVVGGYLLDGPSNGSVAESGQGPARGGRRLDVDALAPSDLLVQGLSRGIPALANRSPGGGLPLPGLDSQGAAGLQGTSLAAPWVARQVLNAVANDARLLSRGAVVLRLRQLAAQTAIEPPIVWTERPLKPE